MIRRRGFLKRLGSVFAAALGLGDARADQGVKTSEGIIPFIRRTRYQGPSLKVMHPVPFSQVMVYKPKNNPLAKLVGGYPKRNPMAWLEAGAGVEPAMDGHEPPALPLGYPADDHSNTKGGI